MVDEKLLIAQLGITEKKIRAARPTGAVVVHATGVLWPLLDAQALATHLGGSLTLPEKNAPSDVETLTVVSYSRGADGRHFPNKNIIAAQRSGGDVVNVRVMDSGKYRRVLRIGGQPMTLKARKSDSGNWWVLVGREPISAGQWT